MSFNDNYLKLRKKRLEEERAAQQDNSFKFVSGPYQNATKTEYDIGPVQTSKPTAKATDTSEKEQKGSNSWFQKGAFEDGYQLGDISKTILGTIQDVGDNVNIAVVDATENLIDTTAYGVGVIGGMFSDDFQDDVGDFIAKDLLKSDTTGKALHKFSSPLALMTDLILQGKTEDNSVLGEKSDGLVQSGAHLAGSYALAQLGVPAELTMGVNAFGSEIETAYQNGATHLEAGISGAISAGAEILFERFSGGIKILKGTTVDDAAVKWLSKNVSNKVVRTLAKFGMDMAGEGAEEVATEAVSAVGRKLTYADEQEWEELFSSEDAWDAFVGGAVMSGVAGGGKMASSNIKGRDYTSGLTANEETVLNKVYNDRVAKAEQNGTKLTDTQKNEIYKQVEEELKKGYLSTDDIESALGGETYKTYRDTIDSEDAILKEFDELGKKQNATLADQARYAELQAQVKEIKSNSNRNNLKSQLSEEVYNSVKEKDSYLAESYNERARRGTAFEADLSKYDKKSAETVKKAIDSGILNNTRRTHEFVDMVAKISADKGVLFDFTNNQKLKESGFAIDGAAINGYVTKDGVAVNIDSHKSLNSVVGHEITHVLEGTELYAEMQKAIFEYAKSKKDYDSRRKSLEALYKNVKGAEVDAELTADLVGDYLFTDEDFINNLSTKHRNVFQKIYDEIKYLLKIATKGSKEARELEKAKRAFDRAYRENGKASGDTKYSISDKNIKDVSTGYAYGESYYTMSYTQDGKVVGTLEYGEYDGEPNVKMVEVDPEYRRKGIGTKLLQELQRKYPDVEIDFGMSTPDGTKLLDAITYDVTDNAIVEDRQKLKDLQTELNELQEKLDVLYDTENLTEAQDKELQVLGDRWQEVYETISGLEKDLRGKKATKTFVKTDTKYSLSTDSDGKKLTKEQSEYFKDSKMRDENGNLKVMYHGSQDAGFHTFDANMSDDDTSFFFVDRNDVAASYSGTSETYEAQTIRTAEDMNNFIESIGVEGYEVVEKDGKFTLFYEGDRIADSNTPQGIYEEFCWYEGVGEGDANYKVYLNLTNPLEVDAEGRNWNNISREFSQEVYGRYKSLTTEEKAALSNLAEWGEYSIFRDEMLEARATAEQGGSGVFDEAYTKNLARAYEKLGGANANLYDAFSIAQENFSEESLKMFAVKQMNTRDYARKAKAEGYDGVIFKNIHDNGGYSNGSEGASTVAIAFESNQIKSVANEKPTGNADIRYSLSESEQTNNDVKVMDGGSVTKYSLSTWTPETQTKVRENLIKSGYEADRVDKWIKDTNSVASIIAADKDRLDFVAADNQVMLKDNQEYIKTLDASTLCAKRLVYQGTFDAIQHRLPNTMLSSDDLIDLLNMMKEHGVQTPCGVCYVESRRRHLGKFAQGWLDSYNGEYKPNLDEVTTSDGLETLRKSHPQTYKDFVDAMNKKGSSNPKVVQLRTEYRNEIMSLTPKQIRDIESIGGLRVQSFSDFETPHLLDMMQAVMDMSAKGLHSQAYTKVPNFAWVFGDTGIKINLSLIAEGDGFDADGNLIFSSTEGMNIDEAMKLRDAYSQNVGTIIVGANDKHILACMADDRIDFIIPFHRSGWGMKELEMMGMSSYTDYTYGQKEHDLATGKGVANLYPADYWDYTLSGKENAERYLNLCAKTGREPKFSKFLVNNGDGSYSLQPDGATDGYWKTLIDFKMYDNEGNGAIQQKVQPNFNMEEAYRVLGEYEGGANKLPVANDVVEEFVAKYRSYQDLAPAMSLSAKGETPKRYGNYNVYGDDIRLEAPIQEDVAPVDEAVDKAVDEVVAENAIPTENFAPLPSEPTLYDLEQEQAELEDTIRAAMESNDPNAPKLIDEYGELLDTIAKRKKEESAMESERLASLDDKEAPPEVEAPYYDENSSAINPFDERDIKAVGNRKVKAYMYENPEVKPFFQEEANVMLGELRNGLKGERIYTPVEGGVPGMYGSDSYGVWHGIKRNVSADIAYLLDELHFSYADIRNGLNAIIEDNGKENNAVSKRIEFVLNDRLMKGYYDFATGIDIPPDQDYINLLKEKQITEYSEEARAKFFEEADKYAPFAEDISPIAENTAQEPIIDKPIEDAPIAEAYEAIKPKKQSAEPRMKRVKEGESSPNKKERKWIGTSTESEAVDGKILPEDLDQEAIHYQPISNKKTLSQANVRLDRMGYEASLAYFNSQFANKKTTVEDIVLGERLIQEAIKRGDTQTAGALIEDVAILGTELGQKVQALSIIKRLTPEGQLRMLQRTVERGKTREDKAYEGVEITQEMIDKILKTYGKDGTFDQAKLNEAVEDAKQKIADQMKVTIMDKVNAWRYLSMLGNPKTHIRNLVSNIAMQGTVKVKNALARTIETFAPIENKTKTWRAASSEVKAFSQKTAIEMQETLSDGGKYNEDTSIKQKRAIFKNKILNGVYEFNSDLLSKEDWWFSKPAFTSALSEYLTANGIRTKQDIQNNPKIVAKAKQYATEQSQIATFRQYSWLSNKINEIEHKNIATQVAVGAVLPFKKTPINIAKTALNYSPLGFAKTLTYDAAQVKNGKMEASQLVDHLAQNVTGSSLVLIGYMLAAAGILNGAGDDDKEGDYDYQLGEQAYSINIGDATFSLSWLSPIAMPLFVGANAYEQLVEGKEWNGDVVVETLAQTLDPLSEMSFLSSLDSVLSSYDSGIEKFAGMAQSAGQSYITQFVPTLSSQIAAVKDDKKRSTKVAADSEFKFVDETINKLKYKIPFLRETLEPSTDIWGNEIKQSENVMERAFETFFAPYSKKEDISTGVDEELKTLYKETGDAGLIPSIPNNYINYDGEKYEMSASEYTEYKELYGQNAYELMSDLFKTNTYKNASSEERADMVNRVYDFARDEAKREYFAKYGVEFTNATKEGEEYYKENSIKGAIKYDMTPDEYEFATENPEKYKFLHDVGLTYEEYDNGSEDFKDAYSWAFKNPEKFTVSKAVASDVVTYRKYASEMYDIKADKDEYGKSISGSRKEKVIDYVNNLDIDYGARLILFKSEYNADDTYNYDIIDYLNSREDISYEEMETILKELGFIVRSDGTILWD